MTKTLFISLSILLLSYSTLFSQDSDTTKTKSTTDKKVKFAGIPMINYSSTYGLMGGVMGMAFYKLNKNDTISPSSSTGFFGGITTNNTWFGMAFQKFYLKEDKYRITAGLGSVSVNFQFFIDIPIYGGTFIDYNTSAKFLFIEGQRKVYNNLYAGANYSLVGTTTEYYLRGNTDPDTTQTSTLNNIGLVLSYDSRDNVNNPEKGWFVNLKSQHRRDWLGSDYDFDTYELSANKFFNLSQNDNSQILLARFMGVMAVGDVPFEGQSMVGRDDIRGYTNGKHRGEQVYALQAEYRWNFYKKWGMIGFVGVADAVDNIKDIRFNNLLPGAGVGIRYLMIPSERINVGMDVAVGKEDWGIYFRIGEAFGR